MADHFTDSGMARIYTRESATQRGTSGTALAGSVAAALRLLAKAVLTGNHSRILEWLSVACPRIMSTDVDVFICKAIDGLPASPDHLGRLEEEGRGHGKA